MATASQVLPRELRLTAPPTLPQARSYLFKQKSALPQYTEKQQIQINIPRLQRSYLTKGSYLKFRLGVKANWGAAHGGYNLSTCLDTPGAYGLIDRIEVYDYLGSTLLESTSGHGQLMALLTDVGITPQQSNGHWNCITGTGRNHFGIEADLLDNYPIEGANSATAGTIPALSALVEMGPVSGQIITPTSAFNAAGKEETTYMEFALPLHSFLGTQSKQFVPLHNGFTLWITLNSLETAIGASNVFATASGIVEGTVSDIIIDDVYYCAQVLELGPVAESLLLSSSQGQPLIVHSKAYRNFTDSIINHPSSYRLDLPLNVSSMTALFWIMRPLASISDISKSSLGGRIRNCLQSWWFQYGSSILPQTSGIAAQSSVSTPESKRGFTEAYSELMKAANQFSDPYVTNSHITRDGYTAENSALSLTPYVTPSAITPSPSPASGNGRGQFAAGLNLELVSKRDSDVISGLNTNGMNISLTANFKQDQITAGEMVDARVDAWCVYDAYINISPGLASTVAF